MPEVPCTKAVRGYPIEIVPYDRAWPKAYEAERRRLDSAIGAAVVCFEHMGSTSVAGMSAKPIIDISAAVRHLSSVPSLFPRLEDLGYVPIEQESPDRFDLWREASGGRPSHILHFMEEGSDAWIRPLIFRNALRADPELRRQYTQLKEGLACACVNDIRRYGNGKTEFVEQVVEAMLAERA